MPLSPASCPHPRKPSPISPRPLGALLLLLLLAAALAGCGSSSHGDGTEADPAVAVPAGAPLYLGATVRPAGSLQQSALAAGRELSGQADPYLRLLGALQTPGSPALDFKHDIAPWLGPHVGVFLDSLSGTSRLLTLMQQSLTGKSPGASAFPFAGGQLDGAIVMDTSDVSAARSFLAGQAKHAGASAKSYRGVSYEATSSGLAFGLVGRFAVIGSEAGLRGVIDASQGESSLAKQASYVKLLAKAPAGALAHVFVSPSDGASTGAQDSSGLLALITGARATNISLSTSAASLSVDADTLASPEAAAGALSANPASAQALSELPGESWLAAGLGEVGPNLAKDVSGLQALAALDGTGESEAASGTLSLQSLLNGLLVPLKILGADTPQAKRDFAGWMGSVGVFGGGASLLELKAGIVVSSKSPSASRAAVAKLGAALRKQGAGLERISIAGTEAAIGARISGLPLELDIADGRAPNGQAKFVLGLGEASVQAALAPSGTLSSAASHSAAAASLGEGIKPSVIFELPTLLSLLQSVGLTESPSLKPFLPYLHAVSTIDGGGHELGGGVDRFRIVLGLDQSG